MSDPPPPPPPGQDPNDPFRPQPLGGFGQPPLGGYGQQPGQVPPPSLPPSGQMPPGVAAPGPAPAPLHYSPDGRFVWNGYTWVPVQVPDNTGRNVAMVIGFGCLGLIVLAVIVIVILTIVGKQVTDVFSNITNGLYMPNDTNSFNSVFSNISNGLSQ